MIVNIEIPQISLESPSVPKMCVRPLTYESKGWKAAQVEYGELMLEGGQGHLLTEDGSRILLERLNIKTNG